MEKRGTIGTSCDVSIVHHQRLRHALFDAILPVKSTVEEWRARHVFVAFSMLSDEIYHYMSIVTEIIPVD